MKFSGKILRGLFALVVLALVGIGVGLAQSTATLSGTVSDPTGAVVPGASVAIRSLATGVERSTVSDGSGNYTAPSLQPGDYTVTVSAAGFAKYIECIALDKKLTATQPAVGRTSKYRKSGRPMVSILIRSLSSA